MASKDKKRSVGIPQYCCIICCSAFMIKIVRYITANLKEVKKATNSREKNPMSFP
jgi:hypothetical protein